MKVSIAWIFDHIDADYRRIDIPELITKLNQTTAEIEHDYAINSNLDTVALATITSITDKVNVESAEWKKSFSLPKRSDAQEGAHYLVVKEGKSYRWATSIDLGGHKEMILPAVHAEDTGAAEWKKQFEKTDHIFEVDNKSITHRPDLWGHRGFAREVAAILDLSLKPIDDFCTDIPVKTYDTAAQADSALPFSVAIDDTNGCNRFAGLSVPTVTPTASLLWMMTRLSRVDSRSIDAIVDCTNYVMLDTSQPMHAFDADLLAKHSICARRGKNKESLVLLDDQKIEFTEQDIVIADGSQPVALAGIMGGKATAVSGKTTALFLESANFDAATIRRSSLRHKVRTEASARFEKSLDPNQNVMAIGRFIKLLQENNIACEVGSQIRSLGALIQPPVIHISQQCIQDRIGCSIAPAFVRDTLEKLDFTIKEKHDGNSIEYEITVPTFRATKDVSLKEDIVEEVARFYGYDQIPLDLPQLQTKPSSLHPVMQEYRIKQIMAFGLSMRELYTYSFFDESFLRTINWQPENTVQVKDPVSQNWHRLVTTLGPTMFKAVAENHANNDELRFFEWARTWHEGADIVEKKVLSGIFYTKKPLDFYAIKAELEKLFVGLSLNVQWHSLSDAPYPWFDAHQTATINHEGQLLGIAGMVQRSFLDQCAPGSAFLFELDAGMLAAYEKPLTRFVPLPKYPATDRDVSMMVSLSLSVAQITELISDIDDTIRSVTLVDMFAKKEWKDERALTFRYVMRDANRTMTKAEADKISDNVIAALKQVGATIR